MEPLLELLWARDDLVQQERAQKKAEKALGKSKLQLGEAEAALAEEEKGTPAYKELRAKVKRIEEKRAADKQKHKEANEAIPKLTAQIGEIEQHPAVVPALTELEGSILKRTPAPFSASPAAAASSSSSSAYITAEDVKPSASVLEKLKKDDGSWLATLLLEHHDPTTTMLDFLGVKSALSGIGTASQGVRAAVKVGLPRLDVKLRHFDSGSGPQLESSPRLGTLCLNSYSSARLEAYIPQILSQSLPTRLQSFALLADVYDGAQAAFETLFSVSIEWLQLEVLEVREMNLFLDVVIARPSVVLPHLRCINGSSHMGASAAKLLMLLNRGAFPALLSLHPFKIGVTGRAQDITQEIALLGAHAGPAGALTRSTLSHTCAGQLGPLHQSRGQWGPLQPQVRLSQRMFVVHPCSYPHK